MTTVVIQILGEEMMSSEVSEGLHSLCTSSDTIQFSQGYQNQNIWSHYSIPIQVISGWIIPARARQEVSLSTTVYKQAL
jgi:hypothetical protein